MKTDRRQHIRNAILLGTLCCVSYLAVYIARNILSAVTPQMIESGGFTNEYIGDISAIYLIAYAIGQLVNGAIGDKVKGRYMISFGLMLAAVTNVLFPYLTGTLELAKWIYGMTGFFLSMIYGPMVKVVAENTEPIYATRCSLGFTFSSFLGSPLAGVLAALLTWQEAFSASSLILMIMGVTCFLVYLWFEKTGIVRYHQYAAPEKKAGGGIKLLIRHRIIKFMLVAILTGVVRTTVVFWLPTYIAQYLGFPADEAVTIFTVATLFISVSAFVSVAIYEWIGRDMDKTILIEFVLSAASFFGAYFIRQPVLNIVLMILAIIGANGAATMLWSRYCPSLRDTGMVSGATGFLDFCSYMAAAISSTLFANAVAEIGWGSLILLWCGLMVAGMIVIFPFKKASVQ